MAANSQAATERKGVPDGEAPGIIEVRIEGIQPRPGEIGVALFNAKTGYPVHIEHAYDTEWIPLKTGQLWVSVVFDALPGGDYAVSVVHDENANRKVDRSAVGFPKEGVGFSNGQKVTLKAPSFNKSKFALQPGETKKISIKLDYRK